MSGNQPGKKTIGHDNANMDSKNNALRQNTPPQAELFGPGAIAPWAFLFRRIFIVGPEGQKSNINRINLMS